MVLLVSADNALSSVLRALHLLEGEDLVQLLLQLVDETLLILLGPFLLRLASALLQALLKLVVGDVVVVPILDQGAAELLSETMSKSVRTFSEPDKVGLWSLEGRRTA